MAVGRTITDHFDWALAIAIGTIATLGIVNLYSVAPDSQLYVQQIYWLLLGSVVAALTVVVDYRAFERHAWIAYGGGLALLVLVFLLGRSVRGSTRWISLGALSFQPSELIKVILVIALARYLHHDARTGGRTLRDLAIPGLILAAPMGLILAQPDLGTALICAFIFATIMVLTQLKVQSLLTLLLSFVLAAPATWVYLLKDYQKERIIAFWDRMVSGGSDVLDTGWHAHQSLIAIGSGGWFGKGFMRGTQNRFRFLPDKHTDFPFPVWAEEQGLVGALVLLGLYLFVVLWALRIAHQAKDRFGAVLAVGVAALFFWQTVINLGMVCGLLPVVGMTLPLFSYGGSSVIAFMFAIGLLMNVSMRRFSH